MENVLEQKNQKKLEDTLKQILRTQVTELTDETTSFLNKHFYSNNELYNIKNYCNNKLLELVNQFKKHDVPMFDRSSNEEEIIESKTGVAVVNTLKTYLGEGMKLLEENARLQNPGNKLVMYEEQSSPLTKIKGVLNKVRNFFVRKKDKQALADIALKIRNNSLKYDEICNKICDYNLEDDLADSVSDYLNNMYGEEYNKTSILEEEIIPDFNKLGLSNKIPELKEKVVGNSNELDKYKVDYFFDVKANVKPEEQKYNQKEVEFEIGD